MNEETRTLILDKAIAVWLDADIDTLVERVGRRDHRPLLKNRDPRTVLSELAAVRNPIYAEAPVRVPSRAQPHEASVAAIMEALAHAQRLTLAGRAQPCPRHTPRPAGKGGAKASALLAGAAPVRGDGPR